MKLQKQSVSLGPRRIRIEGLMQLRTLASDELADGSRVILNGGVSSIRDGERVRAATGAEEQRKD